MQVKTAVHESVLDRIKKGLKASIRVDAFPDRQYHGTVQSVAVLPDQGGWLSSDTKVYSTIVTIDQEVEQLKPGMTAVVEIHVDRLQNVLAVPVQAIVQVGQETWVYLDRSGRPQRQHVRLGATNDKFVEISEGMSEGDRVVLNPSAITDSERATKKGPATTAEDPAATTPPEESEPAEPKPAEPKPAEPKPAEAAPVAAAAAAVS